jgi:hypothetical protein
MARRRARAVGSVPPPWRAPNLTEDADGTTLDRSPESAARARRTYAHNRRVRAALRHGELSIAVAMREQPAGLADRTLFEILLIAHRFGRARLRKLNATKPTSAPAYGGPVLGSVSPRARWPPELSVSTSTPAPVSAPT